MCPESKKKIKTTGRLIFEIIIIAVLLLPFLSRRITLLNHFPLDWIQQHSFDIIVILAIVCAVFILWCDDFIKKDWKEKNYKPFIALIAIILIYITHLAS
jgi:UDP-N-acetylmuramyl pentapeptide phosphotransferase/UDP-N-acetylglucosamine-1-phosphate transferase